MNHGELTPEQLAIVEKAEKLFALGRNNDNEHQAAAAIAKAMELLDAHNLDMAMVGKSKTGPQVNARQDTNLKGGLYGWQRDIWKASAELSFCKYWSIKGLARGSTYEHRILGRKDNVLAARIMAEYLQQTIERLAQNWAKDRGMNVFCRDAIAYREGMADRLTERLKTLRRERLEEDERKQREEDQRAKHPSSAPGTALMLVDVIQSEDDLNNDYVMSYEPGTTGRTRAEAKARRAEDAERARIYDEKRRLWKEDRAAFLQQYHEDTALQARLQADDKREVDYELWLNGKPSDTYGAGMKQTRSRSRSYAPPRERAPTAREERAGLASHGMGYRKGDEVGLDQQVNRDERKGLS